MSDREKLIERLREMASRTPPICQYDHPEEIEVLGKQITVYCKPFEQFQDLMREAADAIVNGVTVQKWIPVSDETTKPKDRRNYFVAYVFGEGTITFYGEEKYHANGGNGYVQGAHFSNEGMHGMRVTHWMEIPPLPKPPKECE